MPSKHSPEFQTSTSNEGSAAGPVSGLGKEEWLRYIPGAVYMTDTEGVIVFYNEAAAKLWGRRPDPGIDRWSGAYKTYGMDGSPLLPAASPMAIAIKESRQLAGQELILERPDGSRRMILTQPKPMFDMEGKVAGAVNILVDVTDVKKDRSWEGEEKSNNMNASLEEKVKVGMAAMERKEGEIRETEERYHKMIAEVEDYAILLLDRDGVIRNWNIGAEKIKGYTEEEIVGRHFRVFYTSGDRKAHLPEKLIDEAANKGKAIHEGWRQRKDGTLFWGSIVITALHDNAGAVIGFSKVTRDLTARRMAEEQLRRYSSDLEFQNQELQQFAYAAAHDMKEPLRKLHFYNSSALESLNGRLSEREERYLTRAKDAASRMQRLIDDLLTYSKTSMEGEALGWVDLAKMAAEAQMTYQDMIEETHAVIEIKDLPVVWGISFQLRQLFENLLGNSIKYRAPGKKLRIRITTERNYYLPDGTIADDKATREYFKITVADNGIGFHQEMAGRIFDIFQRLDTRKDIGGTGIGLAICKRVVQNHKGFMIANGSPGKGAQFMFFLPAVGNSAVRAESE
jgi:PAS domain S-box-containing protein